VQSGEDWLVMHVLPTRQGWSIARLAREFGVNWRTARRYATAPEVPRYPPRARPAALSEAQLAYVGRRLGVCPEIRATTLHRELVELGYTGSYASLRRQLLGLRPPAEAEAVVRFETDPGRQAQVDWADCGRWAVGDQLVGLQALVAVLGYSRMVAVRFATDTTRATTLGLLVELLAMLGGAPTEVLSDRDPALVIGATPDGRAVFAPEWLDLAGVLGVTPKACRPYRAQTKGKVERVIRELKQDFLAWLTGQALPPRPTLADYDRLASRWVEEVVATRRHRTTGQIVAAAHTAERPRLRPIPSHVQASRAGAQTISPPTLVRLAAVRAAGAMVQTRPLADYEAAVQ
jgi:transposase